MTGLMESTVEELKRVLEFKPTTNPGDVVLMVKEQDDEKMPLLVTYALISGFERDPSKKDEWWFVHLNFLTIPPQPVTFILQESQFTGQEIFTMGGKKVFIKAVNLGPPPRPEDNTAGKPKDRKKSGLRVIK